MAVKGILAPKIPVDGVPGFLLWARRDNKPLYSALVARFPEIQNFEEQVKNYVDPEAGMGGFMDVLTSIGSKVGSMAGSIGSFISTNAGSIFNAAGTVLVANQQYKLADTQLKLAQIQQPPAQVAYVRNADGSVSTVPVQKSVGGTYSTPSGGSGGGIMATLAAVPNMTWLMLAGGAGVVWFLMKRK